MSSEIPTSSAPSCPLSPGRALERTLFALAGAMAVVSALLVTLFSPWYAVLTAVAGVNQLLFAAVGDCPVSLVLRRVLARRPFPTPSEV